MEFFYFSKILVCCLPFHTRYFIKTGRRLEVAIVLEMNGKKKMKRSEMVLHMQRAYGIRHVMVETGHLTLEDFMGELLAYMEDKGMLPPKHSHKVEVRQMDGHDALVQSSE